MKIVQFILFLLCGLMFLNAGLDKFLHYMPMPKMEGEMAKVFDAFMTLKWLMPFVGFFEIVGGLCIIITKTRVVGGLVLFPILLGIVVHNAVFMPSGLTIAIPLFLIDIWAIFFQKKILAIL
ncbi:DoxX family membrane protein [Rhizosphaericola mali]|uniref:DoxX family membrane protein n=2 Tax=Bacteroidota TaxID=976 RepID=A0A5P2G1R3_9BACT|nr:DoxX family membrane protein [Rhizosphaericola mali]QES87780.1 DoxX family membrane protein [Rhizosphaericola mali]